MSMSREDTRKERYEAILKIVGKVGMVELNELAAGISAETGCSMKAVFEYIRVLALAGKLKVKDGFVELKHQSSATIPSA